MMPQPEGQSRAKRIAILLPNPCNPDYRVIKWAKLMAAEGHDVRLFCRHQGQIPAREEIDGITFIRKEISPRTFLKLKAKSLLKTLFFSKTR
ncbi:hypothetical protein [uncultured Cohaesibacter sp.]|uniref:hypothetical protein n=1 Tax=uncultured Cohaesibacter sp. TaxID=1002546 RepID=UPI0029318F28|nr:hypothetical protein [uncultured Cohaesibacter sp.]